MTAPLASSSTLLSQLSKFVPGVDLVRSYERSWLRGDVVAGLTLAAYLLPASIGDAFLAGLPPQAGLYACLFSGLVFWLFCSSRHTTITVTSASHCWSDRRSQDWPPVTRRASGRSRHVPRC